MIWRDHTPEQKIEAVRELVERQGLTYSAAATQLGTSNVAVAGVVNRAKTKGRPISANSGKGFGKRHGKGDAGGKATKAKFRALKGREAAKAPVKLAPPTSEATWAALSGSHPVPLANHTYGCRWPCGERPFLSCNEPVAGGPYCPAHSAMAFREVPMRREIRKEDR